MSTIIAESPGSGPLAILADLRRLLALLRRGWWLILCTVAVGLAISAGYLVVAQRTYQATARLLVLQQGSKPLLVGPNPDQGRYQEEKDDYVATQAGVLTSPLIVGRAIEAAGLAQLPSLARRGKDPVELALGRLRVTRPDRTAKILLVDFRAPSRVEAVRFVTALIDSYRQFLQQDIYQKTNIQIIQLIEHSKGDLKHELDEAAQRYLAFRHAHPGLAAIKAGHSVNAERLERWALAVSDTDIRAIRTKAQLDLGRELSNEGMGLWATAYAISEVGNGPELLRSLDLRATQGVGTDYVRQLIQEQQRLAEENGPQSSKAVELQGRIQRIQDQTGGADRELIQALEQTIKRLADVHSEYERGFAAALRTVNEDELMLLEAEALRDNLERNRSLYNTVMDQLKQAQLTNDYSAISFQTIEAPRAAAKPMAPIAGLVLGLGTLTGCLAGIGLIIGTTQYHQYSGESLP